jgi:hypothetical protein
LGKGGARRAGLELRRRTMDYEGKEKLFQKT